MGSLRITIVTEFIIAPLAGRAVTRFIIEPGDTPVRRVLLNEKDPFFQELRDGARTIGRRWVEIVREEVPRVSGGLAKSQITRTYVRNGQVELRTYQKQPQGTWVSKGTKAHIIEARKRPWLVFFWERGPEGPRVYKFKKVNHPGAKPNDYLDRSVERLEPEANQELANVVSRWIMRRLS